ncbi:MAG TPA: OsmC family protein, partial [Salinimicrobium sp.]|nr:OsmC family protein [Salinimicrobium sp.]
VQKLDEVVKDFDKAFLIMHSPQDYVVGINNAEELYDAARHPKSFVSLDEADHLLMVEEDSVYAGEVIAAWALRYVESPEKEKIQTEHQVVANLGNEGFTTQMKARQHYFIADEPKEMGGSDFGPTPYEFISAGLAACTSMTIQMYARRKKWDLKNVETHINYSKKHAVDCENCEDDSSRIDHFERIIIIEGELDETQEKKILEIADKCPVHRSLHNKISVSTSLQEKQ